MASPKPNPGQFRRGHDPRRHKFTTEECQRGFWLALESIIARHPDASLICGACYDEEGEIHTMEVA